MGLWTVACHDGSSGSIENSAPVETISLRIGTSGDYPPFSDWPAGELQPKGFSVDVARAYAAEPARRIEWVRFRWPELSADLEAGRFDLVLSGVTIQSNRSVVGRFSLPLTTSGAVVLVEEDSDLRSVSDLERANLALAVNAGGHLERVARALFVEARIEAVQQNDRVLDRLGRGGVEAVMTDTLEAPIWQSKHESKHKSKHKGLRAIGPLTHDRKAAWFPRSGEAAAQQFDRWLLRAETSGLLARLREMHGLSKDQTARPTRALLASLDERLSLMSAVARAKRTLASPVEDLKREARVLEAATRAVRRSAAQEGLEPPEDEAIRQLYRAQIEAAKWIQRDWLDSEVSPRSVASDSDQLKAREELDQRLRPALIFLGDRIATLVVASSNDRLIDLSYDEVALALSKHGLPPAQLQALHDALLGIFHAKYR